MSKNISTLTDTADRGTFRISPPASAAPAKGIDTTFTEISLLSSATDDKDCARTLFGVFDLLLERNSSDDKSTDSASRSHLHKG
jgi:hypothetical protein